MQEKFAKLEFRFILLNVTHKRGLQDGSYNKKNC